MTKILITDAYAFNAGDLAILSALVTNLREKLPGCKIVLESSHPELTRNFAEFRDLDVFPRVFDISRIAKNAGGRAFMKHYTFGFWDLLTFFVGACLERFHINGSWLIRKTRRTQFETLKSVDLYLSSGGGFLSSNYFYCFRLYIYSLALLLGKRFVILAQSVGPFNSLPSCLCIPFVLKKASFISVRENYSYDYLKRLGFSDVVKTADLAFLHEGRNYNGDSNIIGISVKTPRRNRDSYIEQISRFAKYLLKKKHEVKFISHTVNDTEVAEEIIASLSGNPMVTHCRFGVSTQQLITEYGECRIVISNRMHGVILSAINGVPFLSISYEPKFNGLIEYLNYDKDLNIDTEEVSSELLVLLFEKINNGNQMDLSDQIINKVGEFRKSAERDFELLRSYTK